MDELIRRIEELEYYRRGWKATALVFAALWLSSLIMCLGLFAGKHVQAIRAEEQARQRAVIERDMAEAARLEAAREAQAKKE